MSRDAGSSLVQGGLESGNQLHGTEVGKGVIRGTKFMSTWCCTPAASPRIAQHLLISFRWSVAENACRYSVVIDWVSRQERRPATQRQDRCRRIEREMHRREKTRVPNGVQYEPSWETNWWRPASSAWWPVRRGTQTPTTNIDAAMAQQTPRSPNRKREVQAGPSHHALSRP